MLHLRPGPHKPLTRLGLPAWKPGHAWFKLLPLAEIGTLCGLRNEPCLSALVREQDRIHIGKGYPDGALQLSRPEPGATPLATTSIARAVRRAARIGRSSRKPRKPRPGWSGHTRTGTGERRLGR